MSLLLETIRIENGQIRNLRWHNARLNRSRRDLLGRQDTLDLADHISPPPEFMEGTCRCRVLYGRDVEEVQYHPHRLQPVRSLKIIQCEDLDYAHKYADRKRLGELFEMRGDKDEILIVQKGLVTDTSISNIALLDRDGTWVTPDAPLLRGTMRECLIDLGLLTERKVRVENLPAYREARMINCMMDLENGHVIAMDCIR
jgi:4-amino-4-deoxychorismate lyase